MLHRRRQRLAELAEAEARGESFWTDKFEMTVRTKIVHSINDLTSKVYGGVAFVEYARALILRDEGVFNLTGSPFAENDFLQYVLRGPDDMMPTAIEAMVTAFGSSEVLNHTGAGAHLAQTIFSTDLTTILREHRISYDLIDGQMIAFSSREMHVEVVVPTLQLLAGRTGLQGVERAYQDALGEISKGSPADAVTDAGTALQEMLSAIGCAGNALGPLIKSARAKGLFAAHDGPMLDAIDRLLNWVSADRSETGDSHASNDPSIEDAWLIVHVVGAIILRLSAAGSRASS